MLSLIGLKNGCVGFRVRELRLKYLRFTESWFSLLIIIERSYISTLNKAFLTALTDLIRIEKSIKSRTKPFYFFVGSKLFGLLLEVIFGCFQDIGSSKEIFCQFHIVLRTRVVQESVSSKIDSGVDIDLEVALLDQAYQRFRLIRDN